MKIIEFLLKIGQLFCFFEGNGRRSKILFAIGSKINLIFIIYGIYSYWFLNFYKVLAYPALININDLLYSFQIFLYFLVVFLSILVPILQRKKINKLIKKIESISLHRFGLKTKLICMKSIIPYLIFLKILSDFIILIACLTIIQMNISNLQFRLIITFFHITWFSMFNYIATSFFIITTLTSEMFKVVNDDLEMFRKTAQIKSIASSFAYLSDVSKITSTFCELYVGPLLAILLNLLITLIGQVISRRLK